MTTRFVGLPCGTATEDAFATTTTPRKSGANGARKRPDKTRTSGTMTTTAPSSETMLVTTPESTQTSAYQREFVERNHVPFDLLSDAALELTRALRLPTFEFPVPGIGPSTLIRRMAWYLEAGRIAHVWHPVFPPDKNAEVVLTWLRARRA